MTEQQLILLDAIEKGHTSIVLKLLRNRVDLNVTDMYGRTPLIIAAKYGRDEIIKILLKHVGTTNIQADHGGKTALHYAVENSESSTVKILCKHQPASMAMATTQTELLPLDYTLDDEELYFSLYRYGKGEEVVGGESDDDDDTPIAEPYTKKTKKGTGKKKKGGKKSGSKKKKKGGKKKK